MIYQDELNSISRHGRESIEIVRKLSHQKRNSCFDGLIDLVGKIKFRSAADGVINDGKRIIFRTQDPGHQFGSTDKFGGHDGKGRYSQLLCFHRIMQTAR